MDLIKCPVCGEKYSSSYRRCPFCEEEDRPRKVSGKRRGGHHVAERKHTHSARGPLIAVLLVVLVIIGILLAVLAAAYLGLCIYATQSGSFWKGTYVLGQDVSGMTVDAGTQAVQAALPELAAGLKVLRSGIRDSYHSEFLEPYFQVDAQAEDGAFQVSVSFVLPNTMDGDDTAEITCTMDQKEMEALIGELDRLCEKFPDRT